MKIDFTTITYLQRGTARQQQIYEMLHTHQLLEKLRDFTPVVVGTFPLDIAIETSDIDIACYCEDMHAFSQIVESCFSEREAFTSSYFELRNEKNYVANFVLEGIPVEIFAQRKPVKEQYGFRHMVIEQAILIEKGPLFKAKIVELKRKGLKTEPAFALLLGLTGDPYEELLTYELAKS
ncbi:MULTISPECIES: DUF4269 domain-containing protein [unclassified Myroides]|uniref:DUF4269 domain-containing protein n=1 Tax=unclassified Myroides TaxID=2642485 RepID=UPI003D2F6E44